MTEQVSISFAGVSNKLYVEIWNYLKDSKVIQIIFSNKLRPGEVGFTLSIKKSDEGQQEINAFYKKFFPEVGSEGPELGLGGGVSEILFASFYDLNTTPSDEFVIPYGPALLKAYQKMLQYYIENEEYEMAAQVKKEIDRIINL